MSCGSLLVIKYDICLFTSREPRSEYFNVDDYNRFLGRYNTLSEKSHINNIRVFKADMVEVTDIKRLDMVSI